MTSPTVTHEPNETAIGLRRLYGIVDLGEPIICAPNVLGAVKTISIGGVSGFLEMPQLPDWSTRTTEPLWTTPLTPPVNALTWKTGDQPIEWGVPTTFPSGISRVEKVLLTFDIEECELTSSGTAIHAEFDRWLSLFVDYVELMTKQLRSQQVRYSSQCGELNLFCWSRDNKPERPYAREPQNIDIFLIPDKRALTVEQFHVACDLASSDSDVALEYRIQLEAYRALRAGDFRKAVVETAVAAEIALTNAILSKLSDDGIPYGEKLLSKFRTLGGRLELAKAIQLRLPDVDLNSTVVKPRNTVVHKADFASHAVAFAAIEATDDLLGMHPGTLS